MGGDRGATQRAAGAAAEKAWPGETADAGSTENPIEKYAQLRYHEDGTIVVTDDWRGQAVRRVPGKYRENAVVDILSQDKVEHDRTLFDKEGRIKTQIHGGDHGNPKKHPFGENGMRMTTIGPPRIPMERQEN